MNGLVMVMIFATTCSEFLASTRVLPFAVKYLPEATSAVALLCSVVLGITNGFKYLRPIYWLLLGGSIIVLACGALANHLEPGPLFTGMRSYLRPMPFFLLPAVYLFSETQLSRQLKMLLGIALLQMPIAVFQRYSTLARGNSTGDATAGTLLLSGFLSIFLVCAGCVLTAAYMKRRIPLRVFIILFLLVVFPTMINETKVTIFLLPLGIVGTFIAGSERGVRAKNALVAVGLLTLFGAIFVPVYDYLVVQGHGFHNPTIGDFVSGNRMTKYLDTGATVGAKEKAGRLDGIEVPLQEIARDPVTLTFGFGIGNVSDSSLGPQFVGRYFHLYSPFILSAGSTFIFEIGVLGLVLVLLFYWFIYRDARWLAERDSSLFGTVAVAWGSVTVIIAATTFYTGIDLSTAISCLFWYFAGVLAARRSAIEQINA